MTIKIVTDSTADLPPQLAKELGITVVPVYVRFGDKVYRNRVDINKDKFKKSSGLEEKNLKLDNVTIRTQDTD